MGQPRGQRVSLATGQRVPPAGAACGCAELALANALAPGMAKRSRGDNRVRVVALFGDARDAFFGQQKGRLGRHVNVPESALLQPPRLEVIQLSLFNCRGCAAWNWCWSASRSARDAVQNRLGRRWIKRCSACQLVSVPPCCLMSTATRRDERACSHETSSGLEGSIPSHRVNVRLCVPDATSPESMLTEPRPTSVSGSHPVKMRRPGNAWSERNASDCAYITPRAYGATRHAERHARLKKRHVSGSPCHKKPRRLSL